jgi:hypothetical protein
LWLSEKGKRKKPNRVSSLDPSTILNFSTNGYSFRSTSERSREWRGHFPLFGSSNIQKMKKMKSVQKLILKKWRSSGQATQTRALPPLPLHSWIFSHTLPTLLVLDARRPRVVVKHEEGEEFVVPPAALSIRYHLLERESPTIPHSY